MTLCEIDTKPMLWLFLLRNLLPQALLPLSELRRELRSEVLCLKYRTDFDFGSPIEWGSLQPFDGFLHRPHLPQPIAGDQFLRLRKSPIDHRPLLSAELHRFTLRAGL